MNKIVNINLGGYPLNMDEDAYDYLKGYLGAIHRHFEVSEGYDEITSDIEVRLAEIFQDQLGDRSIVSMQDVEAAISVMGTPEEFGAEPMEEQTYRSSSSKGKTKIKTGKRLFRNPEDKVVGGVCSGLAAYFGINDPLWVRIVLVVLVLSSVGFLIPAYLIAWAIVPEAKTSADRLAMRGEPINVSNMGKMVEEEMSNLSDRISEIGDNISDEFKSQKKRIDGSGFTVRDALAKVIHMLGQIIRAIFETIAKIGKPLLMIVSLALALAFVVMWIVSAIGFFTGLPFTNYLMPDRPWMAYLGFTNAFMIVAIPLLALLMGSLRLWSKYRLNSYWRAGLGTFFALNVVSFFAIGSFFAREFNTGTDVNGQEYTLSNIDTLRLSTGEIQDFDHNLIRLFDDDLILDDNQMVVRHIHVDIEKSEDDDFHVQQRFFSRGRNKSEARELAFVAQQEVNSMGNKLIIPSHLYINKGTKYRGQNVRYTISVPEGKHLTYDHGIGRRIHHFDRSKNENRHWGHHHGSNDVWIMESDGLVNLTDQNESRKEDHRYYGVRDFQIEGEMKVNIHHSHRYNIELDGKGSYRKQVEFKKIDDQLFITSNVKDPDSPIRLSIGIPHLESLYAAGTDDINIEGFDQREMNIDFNSNYELKLLSKVDRLKISQKGGGKIELIGEGEYLDAKVSEDSKFDTERFSLFSADVRVLNDSWMRLAVADTLRQRVDESSKIVLEEEPKVVIQETL
ncbi:MAG: PspC domain-containing protein [Bacteroidota bacterium]